MHLLVLVLLVVAPLLRVLLVGVALVAATTTVHWSGTGPIVSRAVCWVMTTTVTVTTARRSEGISPTTAIQESDDDTGCERDCAHCTGAVWGCGCGVYTT